MPQPGPFASEFGQRIGCPKPRRISDPETSDQVLFRTLSDPSIMNERMTRVFWTAALALMCACTSVRVTGGGSPTGQNDGPSGGARVDGNSSDKESPPASGRPRVVVVSIDGCRWDYLGDEGLVNLRDMMERGAYADAVEVTNPSMTAPGHVTLLTGAWSGTHGIVFNKFYDRELGLVKFFGGIPPAEQTDYLLAEPVWATAAAAGLTTAAVHWAATADEGRR